MCGIFGIIAKAEAGINQPLAENIIRELFILSETRGTESSGLAVRSVADRTIRLTKDEVPARQPIASQD